MLHGTPTKKETDRDRPCRPAAHRPRPRRDLPLTMVDTGGAQRHPASTEQLMRYWAEGEGAAKIQWGHPGDFDRCVVELSKHVGPGIVKGLCSNLHQRATGARPGHAPGEAGH